MRTTVTLDPDVEALVKRQMRTHGVTFKQAVNDALRKALAPRHRGEYDFPTFDMGVPRIDITKTLQIAARLEDEELIRRMHLAPSRRKGRPST